MFTPRQLVLRVAFAGAAAVLGAGAQAAIPIQHWTLPNGAKIYLAATRVLPIVDVEVDFDAGSRRDPAAQSGLAEVSAEMVEKGVLARGSDPAMDQNALGEAWADLGANFDVGAGADRTSFTLRSLSDPALLGKAVQLAAREIGEPAFPADVWARERERLDAAIKEANTKPATIAGRAFSQAVYGTHPYGFDATEETLARIDVDAMRQRYQRLIVPCRAKLSIVGAVTRQQAEDIATTLLSRLPPADATACAALPAVPEVAPLTAPKEERIPFDSAQTHVLIGEPGYKRTDPDHFALTVGNYILGGGGFVSRLTDQVREKRGLAYSVYSTFSPGLHAGAFRIAFQTRPDQADEAVKVSREVLAKFVADGPTEAELKAAKDNLIGGFPLLLDSNRKLLGNIANIAWNDLPLDYLDTWIDRMNAVTVADIKAAFQRKLQPDRMVTVIVGAKP
ncbi:Peptidase M16 inactive domain protein [Variovorax sp. SRS16]|uniref:M16 family metallopeptidase n=1 Tax=Variovorax sp. SRS16 TaxID=282217 RepID=UPI0013194187|nr:pitrilysin family protein [Variovorax sp. SRS16]VTU29025.1 Peptidase M16 inactive domain protein [Variovorax sp. SRS16]